MDNRSDARRLRPRERRLPETKSFILTSEFWVAAVAAAAMLFAGYVLDDIANPTAWRFAAFIAMAYIVSRGIAKAGSSREYELDRRSMMAYGGLRDRDDSRDRAYQDDMEGEWADRRSQAVSRDTGAQYDRSTTAPGAGTRGGEAAPGS